MSKDSDQAIIAARLEKALLRSELENQQLLKNVRALLHRSLEYGRAGRVLGSNPTDLECQQYVDAVTGYYQQHQVIVTCLEKRDEEAWTKTINKIRMWANSYLSNQQIDGPLRIKIVEECVPNAVLTFLSSIYHYDTEFDAWFCVLVQNVCKKYIKDQMRPAAMLEKEALSVDHSELLLERLADGKALDANRQRELRAELLEAIKKLSSTARQDLIIHYYFLNFSFKEIGAKLNKSMSAIYKLHHDAIKELRSIMDDN